MGFELGLGNREQKSPDANTWPKIVSLWDRKDTSSMPFSAHACLLFDFKLFERKPEDDPETKLKVITWNLERLLVEDPVLEAEVRRDPALPKDNILDKLKSTVSHHKPSILALQSVNDAHVPLDDLLDYLNEDDPAAGTPTWAVLKDEQMGLATLYNRRQLKCLNYTSEQTSTDDKVITRALTATFVLCSEAKRRFNLVNIHRAVQTHTEALRDFTIYLSKLVYELPEASTDIVIGDTNLEMSIWDNRGSYYIPTTAQCPGFAITDSHQGPYLEVQVPKPVDACMVRYQDETNYRLIIPSFFIGQTREQTWIPVIPLNQDQLRNCSKEALKDTLKIYSTQLKIWMEEESKGESTLPQESCGLLGNLRGALETGLDALIETGQIRSSDERQLRQLPNLALPSDKGFGPSPQEIKAGVERQLKAQSSDNCRMKEVNLYADQLGNQALRIAGPYLSYLSSVLGVQYQSYLHRQGKSTRLIHEYRLTLDLLEHLNPQLYSKIHYASTCLIAYLNLIKGKGQYDCLQKAIEVYTNTACEILALRNEHQEEDCGGMKTGQGLELEAKLLEDEIDLLTNALRLSKQSKVAEIYRSIRVFVETVRFCLGPFLKTIALGAGCGAALGSLGATPVMGAVAGALIGGMGFFFASKQNRQEVRTVLREDVKYKRWLMRFLEPLRPALEPDEDKLNNYRGPS